MPIQYTFNVPCSCGCGKDVRDVRQFFASPYCRVKASRSDEPMIKKSIDEGEFENVLPATSKSATHPKSKSAKPTNSATNRQSASQSDGSKSVSGSFRGLCSHGSMRGCCKRGCK